MRPETLGVLVDIRDAARCIADDTAGSSYDEFLLDRRMRQLVEGNQTIIGEATNRLRRRDPDVAARISAIQRIAGKWNVLVHRYDAIDYERVWQAIHETLPILHVEIEALSPEADREDATRQRTHDDEAGP